MQLRVLLPAEDDVVAESAEVNPQSLKHIHGCGHPVRPVVTCKDPMCLVMSGYMDWAQQHQADIQAGTPCICYFCWKKKDVNP